MNEFRIADYGLIGNSRAAALVSRTGSMDWCCLPEFHSPALFAALLDRENGGHFLVCPAGEFESSQRYIPDTNVLVTHFVAAEGEVRLMDAFTARSELIKASALFPDHEILRIVEGVSGIVRMKVHYAPRIFYGRTHPFLRDRRKLGISFSWKENIYVLGSTLESDQMSVSDDHALAKGEFVVKAGQRICFSLSYSDQSPAVLPELNTTGFHRMQETIDFWKNWIRKCTYDGVYLEPVRRSALVLKLLAHAPSGAIIAAPTTSLPEKIGGKRNWDYRYCWLRDASFTIRALVKLGFEEEAHAYMNWILHATRLTRPKLQVVYSVFGQASLKEEILHWLPGYQSSVPVRIGNLADGQFQLDIYGEVLDAAYAYSPLVKKYDRNSRDFLIGLGNVICKVWTEPDNGIWEIRSSDVHHTHSKALAWAGLDRLLKLCEKYRWTDAPIEKFQQTAAHIRDDIEAFGFNSALGSYTREFNGNNVDASLLVLPLIGYCDPDSPRMLATVEKICKSLTQNDLVYRYRDVDDGIEGDEGSFGVCTFWLVENLVKNGQLDKGIRIFEIMLEHASPSGLFSEEIDPDTHELLGNYPQGFTHIGLINAALAIDDALGKEISE